MNYLLAALAMTVCVCVHIWQDTRGWDNPCYDGQRYTSGKAQPWPFHRRFCGWNKTALQATSFLSLIALGAMMGDWKKAILLGTLPGIWFLSTAKTTVDAPAMALALGAALLFPINPWFAVTLSCLSGYVHERGPVFAVLYALTVMNR